MKKKSLLLFSFISFLCFGQKINLHDVIKKSYSANKDISIINGQKINYILPYEVNLISKENTSKSNIQIYSNRNDFLKYLKNQTNEILLLNIVYENLGDNYMDLILEIDKTDYQKYNNEHPILIFEDKRCVRLKHNRAQGWVFEKIIKIYDEPSVDINN